MFSHDARLVAHWYADGRVTTSNVATGREALTTWHGNQSIVNAAFSSDDTLLATASYDGATRICDVATGFTRHVLRPASAVSGDQGVVWSAAFNPDGTRLATGSKNRRIRLWDVASGQELISSSRHAGTVMCLAWSPDGTQLASGGYDGTVCIWDSLSVAQRRERAKRGDQPPLAAVRQPLIHKPDADPP
ncbi:MAG: hypothetical protein U1D55_10510 [Phycisphaerae bacterium]